jgi:type IV pilus assembly protein PilM
MFFDKKNSILGVDIGTNNIKIVQITTKDDVHTLDTYGLVNVSFEVDEKEETIEKTAAVLKNLITQSGATTNKVVASLPNSAVFTSVIDMPQMSESELKVAIEFEAKKYVPLPISEMTLSWVKVEKTPDGKDKILLTAVPNSILRSYVKIFELAKLEPLALEIEALALIRALVKEGQKENILLIDIGARQTHLNIIENGNLLLTRNIPVGGETITTKIAESLKISVARAEQFKKDFGLNQASLIPETIKPILMTVKTEARQLQSIYQARAKKFDKILIVGGTANLPGVDKFFGDIGPQVVNGDPLMKLTYPASIKGVLNLYATNLAVAIGLALRTHK